MILEKDRRKTILKLKSVFSMGYVPQRFLQPYTENGIYLNINCFEHACFNLRNEQLRKIKFNWEDTDNMCGFISPKEKSAIATKENLLEFVGQVGLESSPLNSNRPLKGNEWKVAYYFRRPSTMVPSDFHFLLQEKNGLWTGKDGFTNKIQRFKTLPQHIDQYEFIETIAITNPYIDIERTR